MAAAEAAGEEEAARLGPLLARIAESARARYYERLTEMELRTLTAIAMHASAPATAEALFVTPGTVKKHLNSVYRKLQVRGRDEALLRAGQMGLL